MIGVFIPNPEKAAFFSKAIQFFTKYQLTRLKKKYPDNKKVQTLTNKTVPTHVFITGPKTEDGVKLIFESSTTQQLHPYYEPAFLFDYPVAWDSKIFWSIVNPRVGGLYAFLQLAYHIRRWWWENILPEKLFIFWGKLFHGGKDIRLWGNWFPWSDVCTEIGEHERRAYNEKYKLGYKITHINESNLTPLDTIDLCLESKMVDRKV